MGINNWAVWGYAVGICGDKQLGCVGIDNRDMWGKQLGCVGLNSRDMWG